MSASLLRLGILFLSSVGLAIAQTGLATPDQLLRMRKLVDVTRTQWKALPPRSQNTAQYKQRTEKIRWITIHHTEGPSSISAFEASRGVLLQGAALEKKERDRLRDDHGDGDQKTHFDKGYGDIAYHFLIGPSGKVYEGRDLMLTCASGTTYVTKSEWEQKGHDPITGKLKDPPPPNIPGATEGHLTVCLIGDFDNYEPTKAAVDTTVRIVAQLLLINNLTEKDVLCHREVANSSCPGNNLYSKIRGNAKRPGGTEGLIKEIEKKLDLLRRG